MTRYAHHPLDLHCTAADWLAAFSCYARIYAANYGYADPHFPPKPPAESLPGALVALADSDGDGSDVAKPHKT